METKQKVNGILMLEVFLKVEVHSNGFIGTLLVIYVHVLFVKMFGMGQKMTFG